MNKKIIGFIKKIKLYSKVFISTIKKHQRIFSFLGLVSGLVLTPITLNRIDMPIENLWIIIHLSIAILGIIIVNYYDNLSDHGKILKEKKENIHFWLTILIQFAYGNLFSTYIVFYFRGAVLTFAWPFLLFIFLLLIGNEIWKKHYSVLTLQLTTLFLAVYLFFIFSIPVFIKKIGDDIFILSGILSLLFIFLFGLILWNFTKEKFRKSKKGLLYSIFGVYILINIMYFLNIIPPIPLSLKNAGVYHGISKTNNDYIAYKEEENKSSMFRKYEIFHRFSDESVYVFGAVFAPTKLNTKVFHKWQYFDKKEKKWKDSTILQIPIVGGREDGYRIYSIKESVFEGLWRVDILNINKKIIGRINFEIINVSKQNPLVEIKL